MEVVERDFVRVKDQRLIEVQREAVTDPEQIALSQVIKQGWPAHGRKHQRLLGNTLENCWWYEMASYSKEIKW